MFFQIWVQFLGKSKPILLDLKGPLDICSGLAADALKRGEGTTEANPFVVGFSFEVFSLILPYRNCYDETQAVEGRIKVLEKNKADRDKEASLGKRAARRKRASRRKRAARGEEAAGGEEAAVGEEVAVVLERLELKALVLKLDRLLTELGILLREICWSREVSVILGVFAFFGDHVLIETIKDCFRLHGKSVPTPTKLCWPKKKSVKAKIVAAGFVDGKASSSTDTTGMVTGALKSVFSDASGSSSTEAAGLLKGSSDAAFSFAVSAEGSGAASAECSGAASAEGSGAASAEGSGAASAEGSGSGAASAEGSGSGAASADGSSSGAVSAEGSGSGAASAEGSGAASAEGSGSGAACAEGSSSGAASAEGSGSGAASAEGSSSGVASAEGSGSGAASAEGSGVGVDTVVAAFVDANAPSSIDPIFIAYPRVMQPPISRPNRLG